MLREDDIPKDVSEAARLVLNVPEVKAGYTATFDLVYLSERIARAILAERERCAKLAESGKWNSRSEWSQGYDEACTDISKQIRNQD